MIVSIDFSLFSSPTKAYGNVTGDICIDGSVQVGDDVRILQPEEGDWFTGSLKVISISKIPGDSKLLIGLQDVVTRTPEDAARLCFRFKREIGWFCDVYD
ncbi:hypothetical protein AGMMS49543_12220 [Betaproteobacteria bacterium]|nr:hypothetical protein AGMMS49543_12220 [Betaproteobacteria bacterium]GHU24454.1 hypothetical protein AGMMS50243_27550 [Betaproteobacteria bacterium]